MIGLISGSAIFSLVRAECWATKTSMPTARYGLAIGVVNNKIYAIGGYNGAYLSTNEEYDPATNS